MIPSACDSGFSGAHILPPDQEVAPPSTGAFSATTTSRPWYAAVTAPERPAAPAPTTRRSHSRVRPAPPLISPPALAVGPDEQTQGHDAHDREQGHELPDVRALVDDDVHAEDRREGGHRQRDRGD